MTHSVQLRFFKTSGGLLAVWAGLLVSSLFLEVSCTSTIYPPLNPKDPVRVYLLKDALHVGMVLPEETGDFVEYGYGDWDWYAQGCDAWYNVFDTVLWPTQGCLGRTWMRPEEVDRKMALGKLTPIDVGRARMRSLRTDLDQEFAESRSTLIYNRPCNMYFVKDPLDFWFLHHCHDAVAAWAEKLGCEVSWRWIRLDIEAAKDGN